MLNPEVLRRVNLLRQTDNLTNWFYLLREYLFLGLVIGLTVASFEWLSSRGWGWPYAVPVALAAVALIGAGQHRLATLGHEASHYLLFRNRLLNELASDWLCMFPLWSLTHYYRLQHLAHHQFPNDPRLDPDVLQLEGSGHRFRFPLSPRRFVWLCVVRQALWLPGLVSYIRMRARYAATGGGDGPYSLPNKWTTRVAALTVVYLATLAGVLTASVRWGPAWALAAAPAVLLSAALAVLLALPDACYRNSRLRPDLHLRWILSGRLTYMTLLFALLAGLSRATGRPWGLYYLGLWCLPLLTSFSFCMIARQVVQHGHAGSDRWRNTRVFLVGRLVRWAVFPLGMDYHLPHHLFPLVPHYRLPRLHELLLEQCPEYRANCRVVEGYFFHRRPPEHATVLELMAAEAR